MGVYVAGDAPAMDRRVSEAIKAIGGEIDSLRVPRLQGVVLGGGYGRGEGGVIGGALSNDLDFFAVTEEGSSAAEIAVLVAALEPVSRRSSARGRAGDRHRDSREGARPRTTGTPKAGGLQSP